MPNELQNTNYHGAVISKKMAEALQRTPLGQELLRFEKAGDKTVMQVRLPEKGRYIATRNNNPELEGQEFDIRVNMNYLVRGMIRASMDENGNIDPNRVNKLENLCDNINSGMMQPAEKAQLVDDLIETLEIPASRRENFKRFLSANDVPPKRRTSRLLGFGYGPVNMLLQELNGGVLQYQKAMRGELGEQEKQYAEQYKMQCENTLRSYREMADMDPEKETRILYPMDCGSFAAIMEDFIKQNNAFRKANHLGTYRVSHETLDFSEQPVEEGKKKLFNMHHVLAADVEVELPGENGLLERKNYTLSLESTAPAGGDLLFRPTPVRTGVGVYRNKQEITDFHAGRNVKKIPYFDTFKKVKNSNVSNPRNRENPYSDIVRLPPERTCNRYYQLHTGKHAVGLSDKKLVDYLSKAAASLRLMQEGQEGFSLEFTHILASNFKQRPAFKAIIRAEGMDRVRKVLTGGVPSELFKLMTGDKQRYAVSDEAKQKLQLLGSRMNASAKDKTWNELRKVLTDKKLKDSDAVFTAVENFTKGKKSVKNDPERKARVDLALDALAIVAENGDHVAKARAQILVDRFNEVRGARRGQNNFVDLEQRGQVELPEKRQEAVLDNPLVKS